VSSKNIILYTFVSYLHKIIHDSLPQSKGYLKNGLDLYRLLLRKKDF